jgi:hypothetical protein
MPALVGYIIEAFIVLLSFFRKIFPWINNLTLFFNSLFRLKSLRTLALIGLGASVIGFLLVFLGYLVSLIANFVSLVNSVFSYINSNSGSSCSLYWLSEFGFVDGFNSALVVVIPFLVASLLYILYKHASSIIVWIYNVIAQAL